MILTDEIGDMSVGGDGSGPSEDAKQCLRQDGHDGFRYSIF